MNRGQLLKPIICNNARTAIGICNVWWHVINVVQVQGTIIRTGKELIVQQKNNDKSVTAP